jgi:hypothetical protein
MGENGITMDLREVGWGWGSGVDLIGSGYGSGAGRCEHGDETKVYGTAELVNVLYNITFF